MYAGLRFLNKFPPPARQRNSCCSQNSIDVATNNKKGRRLLSPTLKIVTLNGCGSVTLGSLEVFLGHATGQGWWRFRFKRLKAMLLNSVGIVAFRAGPPPFFSSHFP